MEFMLFVSFCLALGNNVYAVSGGIWTQFTNIILCSKITFLDREMMTRPWHAAEVTIFAMFFVGLNSLLFIFKLRLALTITACMRTYTPTKSTDILCQ